MTRSPIILIDDDPDDIEFFVDICKSLQMPNEIITFNNSEKAFNYLVQLNHPPFFILCDVNMPRITGLQLRNKISENEKLRQFALPFLMWSTSSSELLINQAYSLNIQGFFTKPGNLDELRQIVETIISYWSVSSRPYHL